MDQWRSVDASRRARKAGHRLVLVRGSQNLDRMFALTGSSDEVEIAGLRLVDERDQRPPQPAGDDPAA